MNPSPTDAGFRWRPRTFLLFGAATVLFVAGVAARNPVPILVAFPLLLAPLAAPLAGPRSAPGAEVRGEVGGFAGNVDVALEVLPDPPMLPGDLRVDIDPPGNLVERAPPTISVEGPRLRVALSWSAPEPTVTSVPLPTLLWEDPAGLIDRPVAARGDPLVVERYPPELRRSGLVHLQHTIPIPGETRSRAIGTAGEFFGIREAELHDPPRLINWAATARVGRRLANEFLLDRTGDVLILLDARPTSLGPTVDTRLLGVSRAAAYGLADAFLREKTRVGLAVFGEFVTPLPLSAGRTHRLRIHDLLLTATVSATAGPSERCAVALARFYPRGLTTLVLSSLADEEAAGLVPYLRRRGYRPVVLSPSHLPFAVRQPQLDPEDEAIALRVARLLRREQIARAWRDGPAIDWEEYWSLSALVGFLGRPAGRAERRA